MPKVRSPKNELEREFKQVCDEVAPKMQSLLDQLKKLSDDYGVPFGTYVPRSFQKTYFGKGDDDDTCEMNDDLVAYVGKIAPVDLEFWYSSTADCELFR